eukprot:6722736-Prymnesium_polylepis.1
MSVRTVDRGVRGARVQRSRGNPYYRPRLRAAATRGRRRVRLDECKHLGAEHLARVEPLLLRLLARRAPREELVGRGHRPARARQGGQPVLLAVGGGAELSVLLERAGVRELVRELVLRRAEDPPQR